MGFAFRNCHAYDDQEPAHLNAANLQLFLQTALAWWWQEARHIFHKGCHGLLGIHRICSCMHIPFIYPAASMSMRFFLLAPDCLPVWHGSVRANLYSLHAMSWHKHMNGAGAPMMPVGPRLTQPQTYKPGSTSLASSFSTLPRLHHRAPNPVQAATHGIVRCLQQLGKV